MPLLVQVGISCSNLDCNGKLYRINSGKTFHDEHSLRPVFISEGNGICVKMIGNSLKNAPLTEENVYTCKNDTNLTGTRNTIVHLCKYMFFQQANQLLVKVKNGSSVQMQSGLVIVECLASLQKSTSFHLIIKEIICIGQKISAPRQEGG